MIKKPKKARKMSKKDEAKVDREKLRQESKLSPIKLLETKWKEKEAEFKRPNIFVCGYTGIGKTTILQKIFGNKIVPDSKIGHGEPRTAGFDEYQNELIKIYDSAGLESGQTEKEFLEKAKEFVRSKQESSNIDGHIHLGWYCISISGGRVTDCDLSLIKNVFPNVIVVGTKSDIAKQEQCNDIKKRLISSGVKKGRIVYVAEDDRESILKLVDLSYELLPAAYQDAFISAQMVDIEKKKEKCQLIIHGAAVSAAGVGGGNPIPGPDAAIIMPIQAGMIVGMGMVMGIPNRYRKNFLPLLAAAAGKLTVSSLLKLIPGVGQGIQAGVAAALTEAIGWLSLNYFEKCAIAMLEKKPMPDFLFDKEEFKDIFETLLSQGSVKSTRKLTHGS